MLFTKKEKKEAFSAVIVEIH